MSVQDEKNYYDADWLWEGGRFRYIDEGEYYIIIETIDTRNYLCFGEDYNGALEYCKNNNIPTKRIKQWHNNIFEG